MALPGGGFAAALSAETRGVEGATYEWTHDELAEVLTGDEFETAVSALGAEPAGSLRVATLHRPGGRGADADAVDAVLAKLAAARAQRPQPDVDGKLLTAWNAMTARGLIDAGVAFSDSDAVEAGTATVTLLLERALRDDGVLREVTDPSVAHVRLLEDAAHLAAAMLTAADVTGDAALRDRALDIHLDALERFGQGPVLYMTPAEIDLPVRPREGGDTAVPSGASTTIENAVRIGLATGDASHLAFARSALAQAWSIADFAPEQTGRFLAVAVELELAGRS